MPIDDLAGVIETLQHRIRQHGPTLRANETRTRMALLDPLLCALGWDTSDPALVTPEYRVEVGWADYALRGPGSQPVAVIEAKRLGSIIDNHLEQAVGYCIQQGIAYAAVTDGSHWQLYRTFEPVPLADKLVLDVRISDLPAYQCALQMFLLRRPNLASGQPMPASAPILAPLPEMQPSPMPPAPAPNIMPPVAPTTKPPPLLTPPSDTQPPLGWTALSSFAWNKDMNTPPSIRFPDNSEYPIQRWRNLIERTASWLWSKGLLTHRNLPVPASGRSSRYVVSTEAVHQSGQPFTAQQPIDGTPLIVEVNVGGNQAIDYARTLLQHCGVNPDDVFVQTSQ